MGKLKAIKDGWVNLVFPNPVVEEIVVERAKHCAACDKNKLNVCTICKCPLPAKTRSRYDNCPLGKW